MVYTSGEIAQISGNTENKKEIRIQRKENKFSFPIECTLPNLKYPLLNCPALSIRVLDKLSYKLMEQAAIVWSSQITKD